MVQLPLPPARTVDVGHALEAVDVVPLEVAYQGVAVGLLGVPPAGERGEHDFERVAPLRRVVDGGPPDLVVPPPRAA